MCRKRDKQETTPVTLRLRYSQTYLHPQQSIYFHIYLVEGLTDVVCIISSDCLPKPCTLQFLKVVDHYSSLFGYWRGRGMRIFFSRQISSCWNDWIIMLQVDPYKVIQHTIEPQLW